MIQLVEAGRPAAPARPVVYLAMPRYSEDVKFGAAGGFFCATAPGSGTTVLPRSLSGSILTHVFNRHWGEAVNHRDKLRLSHFAMIHADVAPAMGWLDQLLPILFARNADVLSVVVPLKCDEGITSTGLYDPAHPGRPVRRLTLHEIYGQLPETFGDDDLARAGFAGHLVVNTGLWVCRLDRPWVRGVKFHVRDEMDEVEGQLVANMIPEDWGFSIDLKQVGARVLATRAVALQHFGDAPWDNQSPWGLWQTDEQYHKLVELGVYG